MKVKGYFWGCFSSATYGLIPLFALPVLRKSVSFDSLLFYRFTGAAILLALIMLIRKTSFRITKKEFKPLVILGVLFALSAQFLFWSYSYLEVSLASTILFVYPVFVAILMGILFKERISKTSFMAIAIALCGVSLLYKGDNGISMSSVGLGLILMSALSYASFIVIVNKSAVKSMSGERLIFFALSVSSIFFFFKAELGEGIQALPDLTSAINVTMLIAFPTVLSCIAMVYSVQYIGSTSTAVLGALEPVTAVAIGVFAFNERFTLNLAVGIALILIAVSLIVLSGSINKLLKSRAKHI